MDQNINSIRDRRLFIRDLHAGGTKGEALLWYSVLKAKKMNGYQFHRRYPVKDSIVDFICLKLNLVIEIDRSLTYLEISAAQKRREDLMMNGYVVLNFPESEVINQPDAVVEKIRDAVELLADNLNQPH